MALAQGDVVKARAAVEKISAATAFPLLRIRVLFYGRDYPEAERLSLAQWQGKDEDFARFFAMPSALVARARGDVEKMRSYLLAARRANEPLLREQPDPGVLSDVGVIDAGLGRKEDALRESRRALELRPIASDALEGPEHAARLATVYAWTGERDLAIAQLSSLVKVPNGVSYGELKLDPTWDSLRDDPRFGQIMEEAAKPISLQ